MSKVNYLSMKRSQMKKFLKKLVYSSGILKKIYFCSLIVSDKGHCFRSPNPALFEGWGMLSINMPPWKNSDNINFGKFNKANSKLLKLVSENKFNLSQFNRDAVLVELDQLQWRHYIVYSSILLARRSGRDTSFSAVEIGVCDGLTAAYAIDAIKEGIGCDGRIYLIDAWQAMRDIDLLEAEKGAVGAYGYLSLQNTIENLQNFPFDIIYIKGYVPEILNGNEVPEVLDWLHIDLNASQPTVASLDFFWDRLRSGGVVLLDDYGFVGYEDTRNAVDQWVNKRDAFLMAIPTGQAIIFKG